MTILKTAKLTKKFGGLTAVNNVDLEVKKGETLGIIGPNGAGKTTLFSLVGGFIKPTSGQVWFDGEEVTGQLPHKICQAGLARTFQVPKPFPQLTVLENIIVGAHNRNTDLDRAREVALEVSDFVGFGSQNNEFAANLTTPDCKRLEIARALATEPKLILLDEVMAGLRPLEQEKQIELARRINEERGITIILIEHVMKVIMELSSRIVVINYGVKIGEGQPEEVVNMPEVIEAYLGTGGMQHA